MRDPRFFRSTVRRTTSVNRTAGRYRRARRPDDWSEDRGFSVGFSICIDPEDLEALEQGPDPDKEWNRLEFEAAKEIESLFGNPVALLESDGPYCSSADFKNWVTDLEKFASIIAANDGSLGDGIIFLSNGLYASNFMAIRGHWGRPSEVVEYSDWDETFLDAKEQ